MKGMSAARSQKKPFKKSGRTLQSQSKMAGSVGERKEIQKSPAIQPVEGLIWEGKAISESVSTALAIRNSRIERKRYELKRRGGSSYALRKFVNKSGGREGLLISWYKIPREEPNGAGGRGERGRLLDEKPTSSCSKKKKEKEGQSPQARKDYNGGESDEGGHNATIQNNGGEEERGGGGGIALVGSQPGRIGKSGRRSNPGCPYLVW